VHSLTESGRAELDAWLMSPLEPNTVKDPLLARLFFAARLGHERVDALLSEAEERIRRELEELEEIDIDVVDLDTAMKAAVLRCGIDGTKAQLEWVAQTRRAITADASTTRSRTAEGTETADEDAH